MFEQDLTREEGYVRWRRGITFVACGAAYHASLVGKYLVERLARIPCDVEIASEYRYREPVVSEGQLVVAVTQRIGDQLGDQQLDRVHALGAEIGEGVDHRGARLGDRGRFRGQGQLQVADRAGHLVSGVPAVSAAETHRRF